MYMNQLVVPMSNIKDLFLSARGRISASEYVVSVVLLIILSPILAFLLVVISAILPNVLKVIVFAAFFVLVIWSCFALIIKRLHDRGHGDGWALLCLVPVVNVMLFFYLIFCKSVPRTNRFGRCPATVSKPLSIVCYAIIILSIFYSLKMLLTTASGLPPPAKPQPVKDYTGSRKFYSVAHSDILLNRTKFSTKNKDIKYAIQIVIGQNKNGYQPPQIHIKRVINDRIEQDCLSYLFNKPHSKTPNDPRMSSFEYYLPDNAPIDRVYGFSSIYVRTTDPSWNMFERMFGMGYIGVGVGYSHKNKGSAARQSKIYLSASLFGTKKFAKLVPVEGVQAKKADWRLKDDIVAAFGSNSNCNPLGHNRQCAGCLFQR